MAPPVPSEGLGGRLPVLLVLLDRKIHKPEHTEDPSCEHPGKQWPSHGVLRCFKSNVVSTCVFDFDLPLKEKGNDHSSIDRFSKNGKTNYGTRAFNENPSALSGSDSAASADPSAARRKIVAG